ncbi:hypothetical protein XI08_22085 [Bradyrhizobium sp. CCBAU 11361]|nr:hypothetical protein [Bradyrhizobium sp. CCBAU 11361]
MSFGRRRNLLLRVLLFGVHPAISDQSALVPIMVWAAAVLLIALAANRAGALLGSGQPSWTGALSRLQLFSECSMICRL